MSFKVNSKKYILSKQFSTIPFHTNIEKLIIYLNKCIYINFFLKCVISKSFSLLVVVQKYFNSNLLLDLSAYILENKHL